MDSTILDTVKRQKEAGATESEIAKSMGITVTDFRRFMASKVKNRT